MLVIIFEQNFSILPNCDTGGRSLLIGDCLENYDLATSNAKKQTPSIAIAASNNPYQPLLAPTMKTSYLHGDISLRYFH